MKRLALLPLSLFFAACVSTSPRYQVTVGNGHESKPLRDVEMSVDGKSPSQFSVIVPQKEAAAKPFSGLPPREIHLAWTDTAGKRLQQTIDTSASIKPDFRGQIVLEITPEGLVTLTPVRAQGKALSTIPWGVPEQWEGSVFLPGMNE
jgi:hypothetical protein